MKTRVRRFNWTQRGETFVLGMTNAHFGGSQLGSLLAGCCALGWVRALSILGVQTPELTMAVGPTAGSAAFNLYSPASGPAQGRRSGYMFEAKADPQTPDHYTAQWVADHPEPVLVPPLPAKDSASRAYLSVSNLRTVKPKIDTYA